MELERIIETFVVLVPEPQTKPKPEPEPKPAPPEPPKDVLREPKSQYDFRIGMLVRHRLRGGVMMICHLLPNIEKVYATFTPGRSGECYHWRELLIIEKAYVE
jgi:hypothetical protein